MVRLLIIDDEVIIANGIRSSVEWDQLGISGVHVAYSIRQAKEIFASHQVDIMICDIEMPQGNGLELLAWVRENYPLTESFILTCHEDFQYAKKAMQLGSLDYLLKPVSHEELKGIVSMATGRIQKKREATAFNNIYKHYQSLWEAHQPLVIERFWLDLLNQTIPSQLTKIMEAALEQDFPYKETTQFLPILASVQHWEKELTVREEKIMEYALRNVLKELFVQYAHQAQIVQEKRGSLLLIVPLDSLAPVDVEQMRAKCRSFIEACNQYFYCQLSCYIGKPVFIHKMRDMYEALLTFQTDNVSHSNKVFVYHEQVSCRCTAPQPQMNGWSEMLKLGDKNKLLGEVYAFLESWKQAEGLDAKRLRKFYQNFLQMLLSAIQQKGLQADQIFPDHLLPEQLLSATRNIRELQNWAKDMLERAIVHIQAADSNQNISDKIKRYIIQHMDQPLSRQCLADHVGLSPDYTVKLFKKETGLSISDYIVQERIRMAKELLIKSEISISHIALCVGFSNFSYFSSIFKKEMSMTPQDYRRKFL